MNTPVNKRKSIWLLTCIPLAIALYTVLTLGPQAPPIHAAAHSGPVFGPACGAATIDGLVDPVEWSHAARQTFAMVTPGGATPFTATLYVMNDRHDLYLGITINDDEFSTVGQYLPQGDGLRIDFDNDHSGTLFALGDDILDVSAGSPQFSDNYIYNPSTHSAQSDVAGGGTVDGAGAASRAGGLNHFELKHPLCSRDSLDFCLHAGDTVGFRLEYLDAQADGGFGGSQFFPGTSATSEADIVIGLCPAAGFSIYLPVLQVPRLQ